MRLNGSGIIRLILLAAAVPLVMSVVSCATGGGEYYGMPAPGGVRGSLADDEGVPMPGAVVYFYTGSDRNYRGPADFMAEPADDIGSYITELPPGTY